MNEFIKCFNQPITAVHRFFFFCPVRVAIMRAKKCTCYLYRVALTFIFYMSVGLSEQRNVVGCGGRNFSITHAGCPQQDEQKFVVVITVHTSCILNIQMNIMYPSVE